MKKTNRFSKFRGDIFLVAGILIFVLVLIIFLKVTGRSGKRVEVLIDGEKMYTFDLSIDTRQTIVSEYGENILQIKDGKAFITAADCPDKICVGHKAVSETGETIICLPHRLVLEISDE